MTKTKMVRGLELALGANICENLHHDKSHTHTWKEDCPVEKLVRETLLYAIAHYSGDEERQ
jgi:hypothetical protein